MYYDGCLKLERKYERFQKAFEAEEKQIAKKLQRTNDLEILKKYYRKISAKEIQKNHIPHLSLANIYKLGRQISN
jgi:hypothetical protein